MILNLLKNLPEYSVEVLNIQLYASSITFYTGTSGLIAIIFSDSNLPIYQVPFLLPLVCKFSNITLHRILSKIVERSGKLKNPQYIAHIPSLIKKIEQDLHWNHKLNKFSFKMLDSIFLLGNRFEVHSTRKTLDVEHFEQTSKIHLKKILEKWANKPLCPAVLKLQYCKLISQHFKMSLKSTYLIKELAQEFKNDIPTLLSISTIEHKNKLDKNLTILDTNNLLQIETLFNSFKKKIDSHLTLCSKFWNKVGHNDIEAFDIDIIIKELTRSSLEIEKIWEDNKYLFIQNRYALPFLIYGIYLKLCKSNFKQCEESLKKYNALIIQDIIHNSAIQDNQCIFTVGSSKSNIGQILSHSNSVSDTFGYETDLVGTKINKIMPEFFAKRHDKFLISHIDTGRTTILNKKVRLYASHSQGHIFPITLEAKVEFNIDQGMIFKGIITKIKDKRDFILVDERGIIQDYSLNIQQALNLRKEIEFVRILDAKPRIMGSGQHFEDEEDTSFRRDQRLKSSFFSNLERKDIKFDKVLLYLELWNDNFDTNGDRISKSRLINLIPLPDKKSGTTTSTHSEFQNNQRGKVKIPYYSSYHEYDFDGDHLYVVMLEEWNREENHFDDIQSGDQLDVGQERSEKENKKKRAGPKSYEMSLRRNADEIAMIYKSYEKISDEDEILMTKRTRLELKLVFISPHDQLNF